ncbi:MAG: DUF418 domain-containing protein [Isosphaeraceae bacterium]
MAIDDRPPDVSLLPELEPEEKPAEPFTLSTEAAVEVAAVEPLVPARPVQPGERVASVDVMRGVALLGILAMNIVGFAWPFSVYSIPTIDPDAGSLDVALWAFNHLVFDTKMMTTFSMLFGAGLVLMGDRAEARGAKLRGVYYRRVFWLLVIGAIHAYLIWDGDILVDYALCGFVLYPFRKLRPRTLILTGMIFNLLLVPLLLGVRFVGLPYIERTARRYEEIQRRQERPTWWQHKMHKAWEGISKDKPPTREDLLRAVVRHRVGYFEMVKHRAQELIWAQTLGFVFGIWWMVGGRMLVGMGLMKLGVFSAACSRSTYLRMMILGYGIGLPLMAFDCWHEISNNFFLSQRLQHALAGWPLLSLYGSIPVVFGHIGAVMLICQSGAILWLTRRLAAVGRMALSNYLFDSIVCTSIFYGYGLDYFGAIHRPMLYLIVLTIWTAQLLISPLWLEVFRYGPAEWLWRSLTYWKLQPIWASVRTEAAEPVAAPV